MVEKDHTQRFSSRVENYVRYRPGYPPEILRLLEEACGLNTTSQIADIAFGTGIFTRLLLDNGNRVFGVEPNFEMRKAGEAFLKDFSNFTSVDGTAEASTLPNHSIDIVTAAQAAHWFDREKARKEFVRILKPGGFAALIWNERHTDSTPFLRDYEKLLLEYGTDYRDVRHEHASADIDKFFAPAPFQKYVFENHQSCDYSGIEGRLLSSSYIPQPDHANYAAMIQALRTLYEEHQVDGKVVLDYDTQVFYGQLA
jgi:SAM-dependent methyltransferase